MTTLKTILLRPLTLEDAPLLDEWDHQPHIIAATSDNPAVEKAFGDTYWPDEIAMIAPDFQLFIAELNSRPIGALQIIDPHTEPTQYWGKIEPNLRAIDIWIGNVNDLGKGYGEQMMRQAFQLCFHEPQVRAIVIDPLVSNLRAHKFYQRLGFEVEGQRDFDEDHCLVHRLTRDRWERFFPDDLQILKSGSSQSS